MRATCRSLFLNVVPLLNVSPVHRAPPCCDSTGGPPISSSTPATFARHGCPGTTLAVTLPPTTTSIAGRDAGAEGALSPWHATHATRVAAKEQRIGTRSLWG